MSALALERPSGAYERIFSINAAHEDLAKAVGEGMTLALSMARAEWEIPASASSQMQGHQERVIIPFPKRSKH